MSKVELAFLKLVHFLDYIGLESLIFPEIFVDMEVLEERIFCLNFPEN